MAPHHIEQEKSSFAPHAGCGAQRGDGDFRGGAEWGCVGWMVDGAVAKGCGAETGMGQPGAQAGVIAHQGCSTQLPGGWAAPSTVRAMGNQAAHWAEDAQDDLGLRVGTLAPREQLGAGTPTSHPRPEMKVPSQTSSRQGKVNALPRGGLSPPGRRQPGGVKRWGLFSVQPRYLQVSTQGIANHHQLLLPEVHIQSRVPP